MTLFKSVRACDQSDYSLLLLSNLKHQFVSVGPVFSEKQWDSSNLYVVPQVPCLDYARVSLPSFRYL